MTVELTAALRLPILDIEDGKRWLTELVEQNFDFHLEDNPDDIIHLPTRERFFAEEDIPLIRDAVDALYSFEWGEYECPIGFMLEAIERRDGAD